MYARLQTTDRIDRTIPAGMTTDEALGVLVETISGHPGFAGLYALQSDDDIATLLTLWDTEEDARRASERTAAQLGPRPAPLASDDVYEVADSWRGPAEHDPATDAAVLHFDGPLSQERVDAMACAGRERLAPATKDLPGLVGGYVLWQPVRRTQVVVVLTASAEALQRHSEAVMSTELLPGEDPALLPEPDRFTVHRVAAQAATAPTHH